MIFLFDCTHFHNEFNFFNCIYIIDLSQSTEQKHTRARNNRPGTEHEKPQFARDLVPHPPFTETYDILT